jgi:hypothetical protein
MKRMVVRLSISLVVIQLLLVLVAVTPALADGTAFVSGSVFVDTNQNTLAEPGEAGVAGAVVHLRSHVNSVVETTTQTDAQGYYLVAGLPYGVYSVWADSDTQSAVAMATIELGEVNATVALDLPVFDNSADVELTNVAQIFLPLIAQ